MVERFLKKFLPPDFGDPVRSCCWFGLLAHFDSPFVFMRKSPVWNS
jgi:hypothetical protein